MSTKLIIERLLLTLWISYFAISLVGENGDYGRALAIAIAIYVPYGLKSANTVVCHD